MNKKALLRLLFAFLLLTGSHSYGQQAKVPRIGYVSGRDAASPGPLLEVFRSGLRELGYIEGKNLIVEYRFTGGQSEEFRRHVQELVDLKVDVFVVPIQIANARKLVKSIPVVMITAGDPVGDGVIDSLARPGGNITGFATLSRELSNKRLGLLKEAVPKLMQVGLLRKSDDPNLLAYWKEISTATRALKLKLQLLDVVNPVLDMEGAFRAAVEARCGAILTATPGLIQQQKRIADLAIKYRLPSMFEGSGWVEAGGMMSYSSDEPDLYRRAAGYVDRILKGTKPADLPVQQPMKFEFVVNLKTAKEIRLNIPQSLLFRADRVIR